MDWANHWKLDQLKHYCKQRVDSDTKDDRVQLQLWSLDRTMLDEFVVWFRVTVRRE
jgi:hypothetical protein